MATLHDAGRPLDADLPYLDTDQIDRLVDQLIAEPTATALHADVVPLAPVPAGGSRRTWRWPVGLAAAVAAVAALTATLVTDRGAPPLGAPVDGVIPVVQAPAPAFDCWVDGAAAQTDVAAYLPWTETGVPARVGLTSDTVCFEFPNGGGVGGQLGASREMVPYFSNVVGPDPETVAFGLVDTAVTRVEFVPGGAVRPTRAVTGFVTVGALQAFSLPYDDGGTVNFYVGDRLVGEKSLIPMTFEPHPVIGPTGAACDPTVPYSTVNAAYFTLTPPNADVMFGQVYREALDQEQPAPAAERNLCLLVLSKDPQLTFAAAPIDVTAPLAYLASTTGNGGTFIWGSLTGAATSLVLTDETGATSPLTAADRDATRTGWVPFLVFVPDGSPRVVTVQPVDQAGQAVGPLRAVVGN